MNIDENNDFDNFVRTSLDNVSVCIPTNAWNEFAKSLPQKSSRSKTLKKIWVLLIAILLVGIITVSRHLYLRNNSHNKSNELFQFEMLTNDIDETLENTDDTKNNALPKQEFEVIDNRKSIPIKPTTIQDSSNIKIEKEQIESSKDDLFIFW